MDFIGERYYKLNRILLLCLGLWPYQNSSLKKIQIIFFETLFISFLLCQFNTFLVMKYDINIIIKVLLYIIINCIFIIKYNAYFLLADNIKYIFDRIRYDWNLLKTQVELEIIRGYANNAKLYTICFVLLVTISILAYIILSCIPCVLDIIMPMNDSRPLSLPILVEYYFVDKEVYYYTILTHIIVILCAGCITITAIATLLIAYVVHNCAMFKIASYRMEHICDENVQQMSKNLKQYVFYEKLIHAVYIHRRALDLASILTDSFATLYFVLLGFGVSSTILSVLNFVNAVSLDDISELLIFSGIIFIHLYYIFLGNYVGQGIIDTSSDIYQSAYKTHWYAAPLWVQKSLLLVMKRINKKSTLTAGGLFDASLEGFATLMSTSMSYVMVVQSMRA
ncbi:odorant receptor 9a-like [Polyergus mexicanus]|uniref:odorant receptor 9a-like n=1 Tax=Polyergus mexicanus TaxID=615972 RepID=UPI0038B4675C